MTDEPFDELLARSSIGDSAWIDCPTHGRQPVDPFVPGVCLICAMPPPSAFITLDLDDDPDGSRSAVDPFTDPIP